MAKLLYLRDGPAGQNVTKSTRIGINAIIEILKGRSVLYSQSLPSVNVDSYNPVAGPSHVVVEILGGEEGTGPFNKVGFYTVKDISPEQIEKPMRSRESE